MNKPVSQFFQDSNGDWSMTRLGYFITLIGGLGILGMAVYYGREGLDIMFCALIAGPSYVSASGRGAEAKENIVDKSQPDADVTTKVNA